MARGRSIQQRPVAPARAGRLTPVGATAVGGQLTARYLPLFPTHGGNQLAVRYVQRSPTGPAARATQGDHAYEQLDFRPSTGMGMFDIAYRPVTDQVRVTVRCGFEFFLNRYSQVAGVWSDDEQAAWKRQFLSLVSTAWSTTGVRFWCQAPGREHLVVDPVVSFVDAADAQPHLRIRVAKYGTPHQGSGFVIGRDDRLELVLHDQDIIDRDMTLSSDPYFQSGQGERDGVPRHRAVAVHESGHMLGLGDEYEQPGRDPEHAGAVRRLFGTLVERHNDDRLMSKGSRITPEYFVTVLDGLEAITGVPWRTVPAARATPDAAPPIGSL